MRLPHVAGFGLTLLMLLPTAMRADEEIVWPVANGVKKPGKEEPSTWDKMTTGTKKFFSSTGSALGLTKPAPQKKVSHPNPYTRAKKTEKKSWWDSWFGPKDPPPPKSMSDFMKLERPD